MIQVSQRDFEQETEKSVLGSQSNGLFCVDIFEDLPT